LRFAHRFLLCRKPFQHVLSQGLSPVLTLHKRLPSLNCDIVTSDGDNTQLFRIAVNASPFPRIGLWATGAFVQLNVSGTCTSGRSQPPLSTLNFSHNRGSLQHSVSRK
jgi:hypothetical protein